MFSCFKMFNVLITVLMNIFRKIKKIELIKAPLKIKSLLLIL